MGKKRNRILGVLLSLALVLGMLYVPALADGTETEIPSYIQTATIGGVEYLLFDSGEDMAWLRSHVMNKEDGGTVGAYYCTHNIMLTADIDMADYNATNGINNGSWSGIGWGQQWIGYSGTFDGNGHTIYNVEVYTDQAVGPKGLLFNITKDATIQNLAIQGTVTGNRFIGGLVGRTTGSITLKNVVVNATLRLDNGNANAVGGLIGQVGSGQTVGGDTISITNCAAVGDFSSTTSTNPVGGLIGYIYGGYTVRIHNSYAAAALSCTDGIAQGTVAGLIAGQGTDNLQITNCYYLGTSAIPPLAVMTTNADASPVGPTSLFVKADTRSADEMKTEEFLTALGGAFQADDSIANGYPIPATILTSQAPAGVISAFAGLDGKTVDFGAAESALDLPARVRATVDGTDVEIPVTWSCPAYNGNAAGDYVFTAAVNTGIYTLAEGVRLPTITVTVRQPASYTVTLVPHAAQVGLGGTVTVDVVVSGGGFVAYDIDVTYDPELFTYSGTPASEGVVNVADYQGPYESGTVVAALTFTAAEHLTQTGTGWFGFGANVGITPTDESSRDNAVTASAVGASVSIAPAYPVTFRADEITASPSTVYGQDYTGTVNNRSSGYDYTVTAQFADGTEKNYAVNGSTGSFTIPAQDMNGAMTLTVSKVISGVTIEVFEDYVGGASLIVVYGAANGYLYNGNAMYRTAHYDADTAQTSDKAFAYIITGTTTEDDVRKALLAADTAAVEVTASCDVNATGKVDISDVRAAYLCANITYYSLKDDMAYYLRADVDRNHEVDSKDVNKILLGRD